MRKILRAVLRLLGRILLFTLARVKITGRENMPTRGPVILAGNHVGLMEVVMMAVLPPFQMEFLGSGDIPLDPKFAWIAELWGFIPVKRGNLDREAIRRAVRVLDQNGVVAVFPEGGIWSPGAMPARLGIALISSQAVVPVLPIGFGGVKAALQKAMQLKRPKLEMNIGKLIPPIQVDQPDLSRKEALAEGAQLILDEIQNLVNENMDDVSPLFEETFILEIETDPTVEKMTLSQILPLQVRPALARMLLHPVIMDIFQRNLALPVDALVHLKEVSDPVRIGDALRAVLDYLDTNAGFFTYRFGMDEGVQMQRGLDAMYKLTETANLKGWDLHFHPKWIRRDPETGEQRIQDEVEKMQEY